MKSTRSLCAGAIVGSLFLPWAGDLRAAEIIVNPGESIQAAIDDGNTQDGDTVIVKPGQYVESLVIWKVVHVVGEGGAENTVIAPSAPGAWWEPHFVVEVSATGGTPRLEGLTLQSPESPESFSGVVVNGGTDVLIRSTSILGSATGTSCGWGYEYYGVKVWDDGAVTLDDAIIAGHGLAGITCGYHCAVNASRTEIRDNGWMGDACGYTIGGVLFWAEGTLTMDACKVHDNHGDSLFLWCTAGDQITASFTDCVFYSDAATKTQNGIVAIDSVALSLTGCGFWDLAFCVAFFGSNGVSLTLDHCTIDNAFGGDAVIWLDFGSGPPTTMIVDSIFSNCADVPVVNERHETLKTTVRYCDLWHVGDPVPSSVTIEHVIRDDPLYVDRAGKDYRLRRGSPCIGSDSTGSGYMGAFGPGAPETPTGLSATDDGTGGAVSLSWIANQETDLLGYRIYGGTVSGSLSLVKEITDKNVTSYKVEGLPNFVVHYFALTAYSTGGESDPTAEASATPTMPTSEYPKGLKEIEISVNHLMRAQEHDVDYQDCIDGMVVDAEMSAWNFIAYQEARYGADAHHVVKAWDAYNEALAEKTAGEYSEAIKKYRLAWVHAENAE